MGLCLLAVALSGCADSPTDPFQGLVAGETELAALALELRLPSPVVESPDGEVPGAVARWRSSWEEPVLEGRSLREELYPALARHLAGEHTRQALAEELARLGAGVRRATGLEGLSLPEFLDAGIRRAESAHRQAEQAVTTGSEERAWVELLRGADALREVGPEAMARAAVARCEEELRRISDGHPYSEKEAERIRHLIRGSRHALEDGDWALAIRRAYYAEGLLAGNG